MIRTIRAEARSKHTKRPLSWRRFAVDAGIIRLKVRRCSFHLLGAFSALIIPHKCMPAQAVSRALSFHHLRVRASFAIALTLTTRALCIGSMHEIEYLHSR